MRWLRLGPAVLAAAVLAACSHTNPASLPAASDLLAKADQAMAAVTSVHVELTFDGNLSSLIKSAQGDVSRDGQAIGSISLAGTEFPFRLKNGTFYLKPPTGGWVKSPPPYDPTTLLDANNGLPSLLGKATGGQTQAQEGAGGVDAYRVVGNIPTDLIKGLTDLAAGQDTLKATVWIATADSHLVKFRIPYRAKDATEDTILTGILTHFGIQVNVTPPA